MAIPVLDLAESIKNLSRSTRDALADIDVFEAGNGTLDFLFSLRGHLNLMEAHDRAATAAQDADAADASALYVLLGLGALLPAVNGLHSITPYLTITVKPAKDALHAEVTALINGNPKRKVQKALKGQVLDFDAVQPIAVTPALQAAFDAFQAATAPIVSLGAV